MAKNWETNAGPIGDTVNENGSMAIPETAQTESEEVALGLQDTLSRDNVIVCPRYLEVQMESNLLKEHYFTVHCHRVVPYPALNCEYSITCSCRAVNVLTG